MGLEYMQQHSGQTSSMHKGINVYQPCAARPLPAKNFKGEQKKQPLSCNICETFKKIFKRKQKLEKENLRLLIYKVCMIARFLLSYHFALSGTEKVIRFLNTVTY